MNKEIYVFLLMFCKDRYAAEDVLQETFIAVYENARSYRTFKNPRAWILTIAKNKAVNMIKRNSRMTSLDDMEADIQDTAQTENIILDKIEANMLLSVLSEKDRKIVILHAVDGFKHREIAELMNLPLGTVTRRYKESIEKMKKKDIADKAKGEVFTELNNQNEVITCKTKT
ncbi:MAG: RNA polymerase sigma factor [Oscillospiraceae bacterium]|nr:RNA polymerase sigma factor [Oscillospiraceae bacterium]